MVSRARVTAFRVDAALHIGSGHLMRCLTLADELKACGCESHFLGRPLPPALRALVESKGHRWHDVVAAADGPAEPGAPAHAAWLGATQAADAAAAAAALGALRPDWLVVDHYALDERWERQTRPLVGRILVIDDLADRPHDADMLLDQNLQSGPARYAGLLPAHCRTLIGPRYALLRRGFAEAAQRPPRDGTVRRILACVGGGDPKHVLPRILDAWEALGSGRPALDIALGAQSPELDTLRQHCADLPACTLHVDTGGMPDLMAQADLLLCGGGTINWERCCVGLPSVMIEIAANQRENIQLLASARTGVAAGSVDSISAEAVTTLLRRLCVRPSILRRMGLRGRRLVDGQGARRVAVAMLVDTLSLRRATAADGETTWAWRNDEATRRYFTDPRPIPLTEHLAWWNAAVCAGSRSLLIAEVASAPVGVIRLDHDGAMATVSIYLDPTLTRLGLGRRVLDAAGTWAAKRHPSLRRLCAVIDERNRASQHAFAEAGFGPDGGHWTREL